MIHTIKLILDTILQEVDIKQIIEHHTKIEVDIIEKIVMIHLVVVKVKIRIIIEAKLLHRVMVVIQKIMEIDKRVVAMLEVLIEAEDLIRVVTIFMTHQIVHMVQKLEMNDVYQNVLQKKEIE